MVLNPDAKMRENNGAIEQSDLLAAVEQTANGIVITGIDGKIRYVNPAFTAMTGYSREEAPAIIRASSNRDAIRLSFIESFGAPLGRDASGTAS